MHVQAKTNAIVIVIYLINVLYTFVQGRRVDKDFGPLINVIWNSGTEHTPISFLKIMLIYKYYNQPNLKISL